MSEAVVRVDRDGIVQNWNEPAERLFGFRREEIVGRSIALIIPPEHRERHWRGFLSYVQTGTSALPERVVTCGVSKAGAPVAVSISVVAIRGERGEIRGVEATMSTA